MWLLCVLGGLAATSARAQVTLPQAATAAEWNPADRKHAHEHFAVATAHPLATQAAADALAAGGTAVDALVAASFLLTVVTPQSTGIGGGGFAIVVEPGKGARAFDFRETAPGATRREDYLGPDGRAIAERSRWGGLSAGVPGYVAGLWALHGKYGKRPWRSLVLPAAQVAEQGFVCGHELAAASAAMLPHLDAAAKAVFAPSGAPLQAGQTVRMPGLGVTLRALAAQGPAAFYTGPVAADIVGAVQAAGGKMTLADLKGYRVRVVAPLVGGPYLGTIWTMPQPSAGGAQVLAMLDMLETVHRAQRRSGTTAVTPGREARDRHGFWGATPTPHELVEVMRRSFLLRLAFASDAAKPGMRLADVFPPAAVRSHAGTFVRDKATASATLLPLVAAPREGGHASHVSILDGRGVAVSATHTVNLRLGSGIVAPNSGVLLNNAMDDFEYDVHSPNAFGLAGSLGNLVRPGARPVSSMTPIVAAVTREKSQGTDWLVLGTTGGSRIPTVVAQILLHWFEDWERTLADAVAQVRVHHQAFADQAEVEDGAAGDVVAAELARLGHTVVRKRPWCNAQAVEANSDGLLSAVSDPRGEGGVLTR